MWGETFTADDIASRREAAAARLLYLNETRDPQFDAVSIGAQCHSDRGAPMLRQAFHQPRLGFATGIRASG